MTPPEVIDVGPDDRLIICHKVPTTREAATATRDAIESHRVALLDPSTVGFVIVLRGRP
jgi:hypothetical protein